MSRAIPVKVDRMRPTRSPFPALCRRPLAEMNPRTFSALVPRNLPLMARPLPEQDVRETRRSPCRTSSLKLKDLAS